MPVTIKEIQNLDMFMNEGKEWFDKRGLNNVVNSITIMDTVKIDEWVNKHEVVIIGNFFEDFIDIEYLKKLGSRRISGIITKQKFISYLTPEMKEECDKLNIPILIVENRFSWSQIISPIIKMITNRNQMMLVDNLNFYQSLIRLLSKQNFSSFCTLVSNVTKYSLAITDNKFGLLDYSNNYDWKEYFGNFNSKKLSELMHLGYDYNGRSLEGYYHSKDTLNNENIHTIIIPMARDGIEYGYLFLLYNEAFRTEKLNNNILDVSISSRIDTILEIFFVKNKLAMDYYRSKTHFSNSLFTSIVKHKEPLELDKSRYEYIFSNILDENFRIVSIFNKIFEEKDFKLSHKDWFSELSYSFNQDRSNDKLLIFHTDNHLVVIVPLDKFSNELIDNIDASLSKYFMSNNFYYGISNSYSFKDIQTAYYESYQAVEFIYGQSHNNKQYYSDIGILSIFMGNSDKINIDFMKKLMIRYIQPLITYDSKHNSELLTTLRIYLRNNCRPSNTSEELYIHVNTLRFRLKRIEETLSVSTDNFYDLINLAIALQCYDQSKMNSY